MRTSHNLKGLDLDLRFCPFRVWEEYLRASSPIIEEWLRASSPIIQHRLPSVAGHVSEHIPHVR